MMESFEIVLYHEFPTSQGLAATSKSSASLPVVGSDSQGCFLCVGCLLCMHAPFGTAVAQSARYPIQPQRDTSDCATLDRTVIAVPSTVVPELWYRC